MAFRGDHNAIIPSNDGKNKGMLLRPFVQVLQDYLQKSFDKSLLQYDFPMSFPQLMVWLGGLGPGGLDTWDPLKQGIVMKGASQF